MAKWKYTNALKEEGVWRKQSKIKRRNPHHKKKETIARLNNNYIDYETYRSI